MSSEAVSWKAGLELSLKSWRSEGAEVHGRCRDQLGVLRTGAQVCNP